MPTPSQRGRIFPIVEIYGHLANSQSPEALAAQEAEHCPFTNTACEKRKQYEYGYCSVTYKASWDSQQHPYAVCDHRLDGQPVMRAVSDYFADQSAFIIPEVTITESPKLSLDYVAYTNDSGAPGGIRAIAIETQAIDLRGGGVGPAFRAWEAGEPEKWREYFTREAQEKNRKDTVDYGVNTGNVYKRLGTQVAVKAEFLSQIAVPLYVIMQQKILQQLRSRIDFTPVEDSSPWDITFIGFDYTGSVSTTGQLPLSEMDLVRTTFQNYTRAMSSSGNASVMREDFVERVKRKSAVQLQQRNDDMHLF
ncbi:hypothetical protein ABZ916_31980 [Streptomyces sp. NPDC046853]|uniref:hypothetical protein n=1 Tax=Streptomyces sp. NPDC046853 TaxID=3154920 RepID=UPI0033D07FCB